MDPIKIGSTIPAEKTHSIIERIFNKKSFDINYEKYKNRYIYSFLPGKRISKEDINIFSVLSRFVEEMIINFYLEDLILKRIKEENIHMEILRRSNVFNEVYSSILNKNNFTKEKDQIYNEIYNYLMENQKIIVDGYIRFRPGSFYKLIDRAIESTLDHIQMEMEYDEFMNMLKYFVDTNPPEMDQVHLILKDKDFILLDLDNNKIDNSEIEKTLTDLIEEEISKSDILLSALIGISPKKIKVHVEMGKEKELIEILERIFTHRIELCYGCNTCKIKKYKE